MRAERTGGTACDFDGGIGCPIDDAQWLLDYSDVIAVCAYTHNIVLVLTVQKGRE